MGRERNKTLNKGKAENTKKMQDWYKMHSFRAFPSSVQKCYKEEEEEEEEEQKKEEE